MLSPYYCATLLSSQKHNVLIASASTEETRDGPPRTVAAVMFVDGDLGAVGGSDIVAFVYSYGEKMDDLLVTMVDEYKR